MEWIGGGSLNVGFHSPYDFSRKTSLTQHAAGVHSLVAIVQHLASAVAMAVC